VPTSTYATPSRLTRIGERAITLSDVIPAVATLSDLLVLAGAGDRAAFGCFYDATAPTVYGIALQACGDTAKAEALTTEVYVAAWKSAPAFDALAGSPGTWLADLAEARLTVIPRQGRRPRYARSRSLGLASGDA
jgi:DNA-directed RNA polymerase specialized sigma24 family protein